MMMQSKYNTEEKKAKPLRMSASSLDGRDFSNMNLENADFSFSSLKEVNFDGAILRNAKLRFSALDRTTFRNADLTNADLSFSSLVDTDMSGARVEGANFSFTSQEKSFNWQDLKVIGLIQGQGWLGILLLMIFGAIVLYGFNAIVYFTAEIVYTSEPIRVGLYRFLVISNIAAGLVTVFLTHHLAFWLDSVFKSITIRHLLLTIVVLVLNNFLGVAIYQLIGVEVVEKYLKMYPYEAGQNLPSIWYMTAPVMVANIFYFFIRQSRQISRKISDQEYQLLNLEKLKTRAELEALQARINPHFLYNALNSIASLVHEDPDKAEEMTLLLSKLFRYTTGRKNNEYLDTVENELEMVQTYLLVEKVRYGDRLNFVLEVAQPDLKQLLIPKFILQPVVENAIKHGIAKVADQGQIRIRIYEEQDWLHLCVHDNGPLFPENMGAGYGIRSIQDKLKLLYGDGATVELHNEPHKAVNLSIKKTAIMQQER
ncbi:hypothetical protein DYBT9275_00253 [Dyadobacter sp. CECT 9275]|uniref:Signal transduction histidine kinase internal region domain-containing protein n=1 Tax=Dyadobacter helix TaxID=2822344 RepID=A0A916J881_9BACT|nr:histidine kinase [Dyadobacter sp. CECT 9275]CAG4989251.1 hypothetical protein DYBT9275_00253 [Dyadobacter sp. CECT 9275]